MAAITRRTFVTSAALAGACAYGTAVTSAYAEGGLIASLLGGGPASQDNASSDTGTQDAAWTMPDWSGYSEKEIAAIAVDALFKRDFETYLSLCAVDDYLDSMIALLTPIGQLREDAWLDWEEEWKATAVRPKGLVRTLMAVRLRALYAADIMRFLATVAADAAGADVRSIPLRTEKDADGNEGMRLSLDDFPANVNQQLVNMNNALEALDLSQYEVMEVYQCNDLETALNLNWLDQVYWPGFALGSQIAAAFDPETRYDMRIFCITVGQGGQELLRFLIPLCRYGNTWQIQRPLPYECPNVLFWYMYDDDEHSGVGAYLSCELPQVNYEPYVPPKDTPFASVEDASLALLSALDLETGTGSRPNSTEQTFRRLFCGDAYMQSVDLANMYNGSTTLKRLRTEFVDTGTVGLSLNSSGTFFPVTAKGYRTLSSYMAANKFGAYQLIAFIYRIARIHFLEYARGVYSDFMLQLIDVFSPIPTTANPANALGSILNGATAEQAEEMRIKIANGFSFEAIAELWHCLNEGLALFGEPVAVYTTHDGTATETMADLESYVGGPSQERQILFCNNETGIWQNLNFALTSCEDGYRVSDIHYYSVMTDWLPVMYMQKGISAFQDIDPNELYATFQESIDPGGVSDLLMLNGYA